MSNTSGRRSETCFQIFVLASGEGTDTIVDFEEGVDLISPADGLEFNQIDITSNGQGATVVFGSDILAILLGISAETLSAASSTIV